jgi:hypothetical protein
MESMETNGNRLEMLERRLLTAEKEMAGMRRRLRATWTLALVGAVGAFAFGNNPQAQAQFGITLTSLNNRLIAAEGQISGLSDRVTGTEGRLSTAEGQISSLGGRVTTAEGQISSQGTRLTAVEAKTAPISVSGNNFVITGKNVFIQNGTGSTASNNGLGNLTIGYNDLRSFGNVRTGSHNLILGTQNNYSSFGGLVAGILNTISGQYATITGGNNNTASGFTASVSGGTSNTASGESASVSGGTSGIDTSISGGAVNTASGPNASVSGGFSRSAPSQYDWRAGGLFQDF